VPIAAGWSVCEFVDEPSSSILRGESKANQSHVAWRNGKERVVFLHDISQGGEAGNEDDVRLNALRSRRASSGVFPVTFRGCVP
jgi:hypothetical protein